MTKKQKITLSASRDIPFDKLRLSQANVRQVKAGVSIEELAEDIARRTVVTVPNGEFSNLHLENFAHRDQFLFHHTINLTYDTDGRTLRMVLSALRTILHDDPAVLPDPARVRLTALGAHSKPISAAPSRARSSGSGPTVWSCFTSTASTPTCRSRTWPVQSSV